MGTLGDAVMGYLQEVEAPRAELHRIRLREMAKVVNQIREADRDVFHRRAVYGIRVERGPDGHWMVLGTTTLIGRVYEVRFDERGGYWILGRRLGV